jgi:hypothetical protein
MTDWLSSFGGPLICIERKLVASWRGIDGLSVSCDGAENDYDRAGLVWSTYTSLVPLEAGGSALVLGGMPMDTIVRSINGKTLMLRVLASEADFDGDAFLNDFDPALLSEPDETIEFSVSSSPLILFDSSYPGDEADKPCVFSMEPGTYRVLTRHIEKAGDYTVVVHRFDRVG